jgi:hypothetical protein
MSGELKPATANRTALAFVHFAASTRRAGISYRNGSNRRCSHGQDQRVSSSPRAQLAFRLTQLASSCAQAAHHLHGALVQGARLEGSCTSSLYQQLQLAAHGELYPLHSGCDQHDWHDRPERFRARHGPRGQGEGSRGSKGIQGTLSRARKRQYSVQLLTSTRLFPPVV